MRRSISYCESRIVPTDEQQADIRKKLSKSADEFIEAARLSADEFRRKVVARRDLTPANDYESMQHVRRACGNARTTMKALDENVPEQVRRGEPVAPIKATKSYARSKPPHPDLPRSTERDVDHYEIRLSRRHSARRRATKSGALNDGRRKLEPDHRVAPDIGRDTVIKAAAEDVHDARSIAQPGRVLTRHAPAHLQRLHNLSIPTFYTVQLISPGSRGKERPHARGQWH